MKASFALGPCSPFWARNKHFRYTSNSGRKPTSTSVPGSPRGAFIDRGSKTETIARCPSFVASGFRFWQRPPETFEPEQM